MQKLCKIYTEKTLFKMFFQEMLPQSPTRSFNIINIQIKIKCRRIYVEVTQGLKIMQKVTQGGKYTKPC